VIRTRRAVGFSCGGGCAYFAQFELDVPCVAMVTASHNDNGWTGVKMGAHRPLTFGPDEMTRLKEIVLEAPSTCAAAAPTPSSRTSPPVTLPTSPNVRSSSAA
jgi:phosphomannomutase